MEKKIVFNRFKSRIKLYVRSIYLTNAFSLTISQIAKIPSHLSKSISSIPCKNWLKLQWFFSTRYFVAIRYLSKTQKLFNELVKWSVYNTEWWIGEKIVSIIWCQFWDKWVRKTHQNINSSFKRDNSLANIFLLFFVYFPNIFPISLKKCL